MDILRLNSFNECIFCSATSSYMQNTYSSINVLLQPVKTQLVLAFRGNDTNVGLRRGALITTRPHGENIASSHSEKNNKH